MKDKIIDGIKKIDFYLLSFLLILLNVINYESPINKYIFFTISLVIVGFLFFLSYKKNKNVIATCLKIMCVSWPISWINIFGEPMKKLQISWFYISGLVIALYFVYDILIKPKKIKLKDLIFLAPITILLLYNIIPFVRGHDLVEAFGDFMTILFYLSIIFCCFFYKETFDENTSKEVLESLIYACLISTLFIIVQFILIKWFDIQFLKLDIKSSFGVGSMQYGTVFMFEDPSCALIMLGCGVIAALYLKKGYINYWISLIIIIGIALTGRRTAAIALIPILGLMCLNSLKGKSFLKKFIILMSAACGVLAIILVLTISRPVDNIGQLFDENGRIENYVASLKLIPENFLGIGYGDKYLGSLMRDGVIPHNTLLRWFCMGGWILGIGMIYILIYLMAVALKKGHMNLFWMLLYSFIASNVIPDILNARYFVIPCALVLLCAYKSKKEGVVVNEKNINGVHSDIQ